MEILKEQIRRVMIETGRISEGSTISIESIAGDAYSDYRRVEILVTKKRCRKPFMYWNLCINIVRGTIHWDTSTSYYL